MSEIAVVGSLNMDLVVRVERMPRPGETVHGREFTTIPGGKGANQAAAAARLGANVEMIGRVGEDAFGASILENMRAQGVGTSHVTRDAEAASGIAMIVVDRAGENAIVVAPGANGRVTMQDVRAAQEVLAQTPYVIMQFEVPLHTVRETIALASELGSRVILNPAPAHAVSSDFFEGLYCLVVNETEAETFTGLTVKDVTSAEKAGHALQEKGVPVVVITLGADGALLLTDAHTVHVPAHKVDVVDTTAAGDAFVGGLAVGLLRGLDVVEAVRYATCAGTLATTVLGAQTSLPSADQVDALYEEGAP
ncbi:MAG: ribokinase [Chloroflexota bacterium]|nr:ribokinase [Chloroflexota bacterium]